MNRNLQIGMFEELVMLAVIKSGDDAYGVTIRQVVEEASGRHTSIGAIYCTLDSLERKGYVSSWLGELTPERGGRAKRYFRVESAGEEAIREASKRRRLLVSELEIIVSPS